MLVWLPIAENLVLFACWQRCQPFACFNHKMELFDNQTKFELFAGFAAIGGVFALVLAISSVNSAALERYVERSNFRSCMIEKLESVCTASYPLGAIK